jgi:hypothetical protein
MRMRMPPENAIRELAWMNDERFVMLLGGREGVESVFLSWAGDRFARPVLSSPGLSYLRPFGRNRVIVRAGRPGRGFLTIDDDGIARAFPRSLADGQALAVSPDGAWVVSTSVGAVHVYPLGDRRPLDPARLAIDAVDLGWGAS